MGVISYKFNEKTNLTYNSNGDIYMLYDTANPTRAKTLVVSDVESAFLYVPSQKGFVMVAGLHPALFLDQWVFEAKKITYHPELKTAKIFLETWRR